MLNWFFCFLCENKIIFYTFIMHALKIPNMLKKGTILKIGFTFITGEPIIKN